MRRGTRFGIGLAAAALSFGSLWAVVGPKHHGHGPCHTSYQGRWNHHEGGCHGYRDSESADKAAEKAPTERPTL